MVQSELMTRIMRDMDGGVIFIDNSGTICYINKRGSKILGKSESIAGEKFGPVFFEDSTGGKNDRFIQFVLDAVYDKKYAKNGRVDYYSEDGTKKALLMTSSYIDTSESGNQSGVVVVFSDVSELEESYRKRRESSTIFAILMICVSGYIFLWSLLRFMHRLPPTWVLTIIIELIAIVMLVVLLKTTSFSLSDIGLKLNDPRKTFGPDIVITLVVVAVMFGVKALMLANNSGFFPEGAPFWDWSVVNPSTIMYPATAVLQEFLARGVMQENLNRIFVGKHAPILSIIVSALIFGILHVGHGFMFMLGATLMLGVLGALYHKQGNIWGLSLLHCVLGTVATFLHFF